MASDQERYTRALSVWDNHIANGNFSDPSDTGAVAILCPYLHEADADRDELDSFPTFRREALDLADAASKTGKRVLVALEAEPIDFKNTLADPSISDIVVIGHGCLSSVEIPNPSGRNRLDWEDLARMVDHLKTGDFIQRMCGRTPRKLNTPLGLLVVNDHRHVLAAVGRRINPVDLDDPQNELIVPVTRQARMSKEDVLREFPQHDLPFFQSAHVALGALKGLVLNRNHS